jgi:hypothetical protein
MKTQIHDFFHCETMFKCDASLRVAGDTYHKDIVVRTGDKDVLILFSMQH